MRPSPGLDRLRTEIRRRTTDPYLLTVTSDHRPHCGTVTVIWDTDDDLLIVSPAPGDSARGTAETSQVSLLWPPGEPGGYSLIADGTVTGQPAGDQALALTVTKAVLHRRGQSPAGNESSCGSDCIRLLG